MSAAPQRPSDRIGEALRRETSSLDDVRRARLERDFFEHHFARAAAGPSSERAAPSSRDRQRGRWAAAGAGAAVTAIAAAAAWLLVIGPEPTGAAVSHYVVRGAAGASSSAAITPGTEIALAPDESATVELFHLRVDVRPSSRLHVEAMSERDLRLALDEGEARFIFHPLERGAEHVAIRTPAARVEIVGTELTVRASATGTEVEVHEGVVRVVPASGEATLVHAGGSIAVPRAVAAAEPIEGASNDGVAAPTDPAPVDEAEDAVEPVEVPTLAIDPSVVGAREAPRDEPDGIDPAPSPLDDEARLERALELVDRGELAAAERLLHDIATTASERGHRATAWMHVGDLRSREDDHASAFRAYDRGYELARGAERALALLERARQLELMGERDRARDDYALYLRTYADGPNAAMARSRLCGLGGGDGVTCD